MWESKIDSVLSTTMKGIFASIVFSSLFYIIGQRFEQAYFPVRTDQQIENIEFDKVKGYICWDYSSFKNRDKQALGMKVSLKDASGRWMLLSVFNRITQAPWHVRTNVPTGKLIQPMCSFIPPGYHPEEPFHIDSTITYPGFLNLWTVTTSLPTLTYSKLNDSAPSPEEKEIDDEER